MRTYKCENSVPNRHKKDNLYPVGHLPLLSPEDTLKLRHFITSEQSVNKRLLICLRPSANDVQTSLGAGSRCKDTTKFADLQILSGKSLEVLKVLREVLFSGRCATV